MEKIREGARQRVHAGARKSRKVAKHCVFQILSGSGGSKSRLAKAVGAEPAGHMRNEKLHALAARSTCGSEKWNTFGRSDVEKVHAVVAQSTFGSKNCEMLPCSEHFWKLRCGKCTLLWREAHVEVKMYKTQQGRTTFGS